MSILAGTTPIDPLLSFSFESETSQSHVSKGHANRAAPFARPDILESVSENGYTQPTLPSTPLPPYAPADPLHGEPEYCRNSSIHLQDTLLRMKLSTEPTAVNQHPWPTVVNQ